MMERLTERTVDASAAECGDDEEPLERVAT